MTAPKEDELVAMPHRHGGTEGAEQFFLEGMTRAMRNLAEQSHLGIPLTIYYAYKQSETKADSGTTSTGWETFLTVERDCHSASRRAERNFLQSEFAADITAVHSEKASREYQDPVAFFDRTFITEGMRLLLTQVAQRLAGKGGEPVIQLQTAFGGGKTHTMLAVYHLANRKAALSELAGIPEIIEKAGLMDVAQARVAVLDGTAHAPGQPWKHGKQAITTPAAWRGHSFWRARPHRRARRKAFAESTAPA
jgi:hypothetical protein